ncbi:sterol acyltransferase PWA37_004645 [Arxiozyma heterogenica]|uniref:sterol acyltransferase n=1 Tax=Arxiozyma heterogenica TaxID=278026 RepID=UPI002EE41C0E
MTVEENNLLQDEQFLKIQKLNSIDGTGRRRSLVYDKPVPGLDINHDRSSELVKDPLGVDSLANDGNSAIKPVVTSIDDVEGRDSILKNYLARLHQMEKRRYRKGQESVISFFSDVDFDTRPSMLDATIAEPIITSFDGPVLEKQIKAVEKSKRFSKQSLSSTSLNDSTTSPTPTLTNDDEKSLDKKSVDSDSNSSNRHEKNRVVMITYESDFTGMYIMMWMLFGWIAIRGLVDYSVSHNGDLLNMPILKAMTERWGQIFLFDVIMWLTSFVTVFIQYLVKWKVIEWDVTGRYLSVFLELAHATFFNYISSMYLNFNWITRVFIFLHSMVILMKFHSFAFFNGYLWNIKKELDYSKAALAKYKDVASQDIIETLKRSQEFCEFELSSQNSTIKFPDNISFKSYFMFTLFPTLIYQFEYPRTERIRWWYVVEKLCAIFGIIFLMIMNAQLFVYPACDNVRKLRGQSSLDLKTRTKEWFYLLAEIIPPITIEYLLVFYLIWDAILNCVAELTRFADRYFYGDWWNCVVWSEFARIWNVPVHKFLLRHIYHSSMNHWKLSTVQATMFTFFLSAILHELCMIIIYRKVRPYLFLFQLSQLPMTFITVHTRLKEWPTLCNILFIFGVCTGPSVITCLYMIY